MVIFFLGKDVELGGLFEALFIGRIFFFTVFRVYFRVRCSVVIDYFSRVLVDGVELFFFVVKWLKDMFYEVIGVE